jgi:hypothetical protein
VARHRSPNSTPNLDPTEEEDRAELAEFFMSRAWGHAVQHVSRNIKQHRYGILTGVQTDTEAFRAKRILFERLYEAAGLELPAYITALFE